MYDFWYKITKNFEMMKNMNDSRNRRLLPSEFTIYTIEDSSKLKKKI